jgi:hypothetical protein
MLQPLLLAIPARALDAWSYGAKYSQALARRLSAGLQMVSNPHKVVNSRAFESYGITMGPSPETNGGRNKVRAGGYG